MKHNSSRVAKRLNIKMLSYQHRNSHYKAALVPKWFGQNVCSSSEWPNISLEYEFKYQHFLSGAMNTRQEACFNSLTAALSDCCTERGIATCPTFCRQHFKCIFKKNVGTLIQISMTCDHEGQNDHTSTLIWLTGEKQWCIRSAHRAVLHWNFTYIFTIYKHLENDHNETLPTPWQHSFSYVCKIAYWFYPL